MFFWCIWNVIVFPGKSGFFFLLQLTKLHQLAMQQSPFPLAPSSQGFTGKYLHRHEPCFSRVFLTKLLPWLLNLTKELKTIHQTTSQSISGKNRWLLNTYQSNATVTAHVACLSWSTAYFIAVSCKGNLYLKPLNKTNNLISVFFFQIAKIIINWH